MYYIIIFCVFMAAASATNFRQSKAMRRPDFENKQKNSDILRVVPDSLTVTACSLLCLGDCRCVSYFYIRTKRLCQLHSIVFYNQDATTYTASPETSYYQLYEDWCSPEDQHNLYRREDTCFKQYTTQVVPYDQAISFCQGRLETLLKIRTEEKNNHIKSFLLDEQKGEDQHDWFYIAARNDTGKLLWSDGDPVIFTDFWPGQPSHNYESCVSLHEHFYFKWNDVTCSYPGHVICERFKS